jgi:hypothetical protein
MAFNLIRSSRLFFTTNVDVYGVVGTTGFTATNTRELQVLAGFSFNQTTATELVTLSEAGAVPNRGQRNFNTALNPVDFSFSTYIRPRDTGTGIDAEEGVLWNAMFAKDAIGGTAPAWVPGSGVGSSTVYASCTSANSNTHQLQPFGLIVVLENTTFVIDNCAMDQAVIDFGLDAIATIAWTGKGAILRQITSPTIAAPTGTPQSVTLSGTLTGAAAYKRTNAPYLANKLSTVTFDSGIGTSAAPTGAGTSYTIPLTGGSITFANNISYLVPANLGVVNTPITYFTGTRAVSGTMNAYLRTGTGYTADLLTTLLSSSATAIDPQYSMKISIGGSSVATTRVDVELPAIMLSIPTVETEQVVSTTIGFTAQGSNVAGNAFDIEQANEVMIKYWAAETTTTVN